MKMNDLIILIAVLIIWYLTIFRLTVNIFGYSIISGILNLVAIVLLWRFLGSKIKELFGEREVRKKKKGRRPPMRRR